MDADSQKDWRRNLSALKSSLARLKIDKKYDSLKDLEKCIEVRYFVVIKLLLRVKYV